MTDEDFKLLCTEIRLSPKNRFMLRLADTDAGIALYSYERSGSIWKEKTYSDLTVDQCQYLVGKVGMTLYSQHSRRYPST